MIWLISRNGSHCVFRKPDFIFMAFTCVLYVSRMNQINVFLSLTHNLKNKIKYETNTHFSLNRKFYFWNDTKLDDKNEITNMVYEIQNILIQKYSAIAGFESLYLLFHLACNDFDRFCRAVKSCIDCAHIKWRVLAVHDCTRDLSRYLWSAQ